MVGLDRVNELISSGFIREARDAFRELSTPSAPPRIMFAYDEREEEWTVLRHSGVVEDPRLQSYSTNDLLDPLCLSRKQLSVLMHRCLHELVTEPVVGEGLWRTLFRREGHDISETIVALAIELGRSLSIEGRDAVARAVLCETVLRSFRSDAWSRVEEWMRGAPILIGDKRRDPGRFEDICVRYDVSPVDLLRRRLELEMSDGCNVGAIKRIIRFLGESCDWQKTRKEAIRLAFFQESARGFWERLLENSLGRVSSRPDGAARQLARLERLVIELVSHPSFGWWVDGSEGVATLNPRTLIREALERSVRTLLQHGRMKSALALYARFYPLLYIAPSETLRVDDFTKSYAELLRSEIDAASADGDVVTEYRLVRELLQVVRDQRVRWLEPDKEERALIARRKLLREALRLTGRELPPQERPWSPMVLELQGPRSGR